MGVVVGSSYLLAEVYGRSHANLAMSNARIVAVWNFHLPHIFGEEAIYWGSEFVILPLMAVVLFVIGRDDVLWSEWLAFCVTSFVGSIVFIVFPVAPPWAASGNVVALGDPFGAMPSLHMTDAVIMAFCLGRILRGNIGYVIGGFYVLVVGYSVVSTSNHYPLDIVAGVILGAISMKKWRRSFRWRIRRGLVHA